MPYRTDVSYLYDGSFDGLLCCVHEALMKKELPNSILPEYSAQCTLFETRIIETDLAIAEAVYKNLVKKGGHDCEYMIKIAFLYGDDIKSEIIFGFLLLVQKYGATAANMLQEEATAAIVNCVKAVNNEAHLLKGFVRFGEYDGCLVSVIEPKHIVLPLLKAHFVTRFPNECFMIFDKAHKMAIIYSSGKGRIVNVEDFELPDDDEIEADMKKLWAGYFKSIAIKERENPICQRSHMPKRFWKHMCETQSVQPQRESNSSISRAKAIKQLKQQIKSD